MGQPVKLSDELVADARLAGATMQRSIAGQVEFWASLGRTMERMMSGENIARTRAKSTAESLSRSIETINQPEGRARLQAYLESRPFPRFWADPAEAQVMIREDADGTRTRGRFVGREFVAIHAMAAAAGR
jgi:hypothetical protein